MSDREFENLEEYEEFRQQQMKNWEPARRIALAAAMAGRCLSG